MALPDPINEQPSWQEIALVEGMEIEPEIVSEDVPLDEPPPDDGSVEVVIGGEIEIEVSPEETPENFYRNLAEELDDDTLNGLAGDLLSDYEVHKTSRADWEERIADGMDLLGFDIENREEPFEGASGATHPLLAEAVFQFQSQALNELLPAKGPARTVVVGEKTPDKQAQAQRVKEFLNYYITEVMPEYTAESDRLFLHLALAGSAFKKHWFDEKMGRVVSRFVPAVNIVVPAEATDLETCGFVAHRMPDYSLNDVRKMQALGIYRDTLVRAGANDTTDAIDDKSQELSGVEASQQSVMHDTVTLIEFHVDLDLPGFEDTVDGEPTGIALPYVVTVVEDTEEVLSIVRNYDQDDDYRLKKQHFTHYWFMPGVGFYGTGLIYAIGGLSKAATAALRQLLDSGTLANLPGGFKLKNLRVSDANEPIQPGEWRDVDAIGDSIRDSLFPMPYKEPSQTLFALLGFVVEAGQRFVGVTNLKVGDGPDNIAMGTVMALIEQGSRIMSAIHKRMHSSQRNELKILTRLISENLADNGYPYDVPGTGRSIKAQDFDVRTIDVLPVSDPNVFSRTQRIVMAQTLLEAAGAAPQLYNMPVVHRQFLEAMGFENVDSLMLTPPQNPDEPADPAQENINALDQVRLQAFEGQDHEAHIMAHIVFAASPNIATMPLVAMSLQKHVMHHAQLQAEEQAAQATQPGTPQYHAMVAELIARNMLRIRELSQQVSQQGEDDGPDPVIALKELELQQQAQRDQARAQLDEMRLQLDAQDKQARQQVEQQRLSQQQAAEQARQQTQQQSEQSRQQAQADRQQEQIAAQQQTQAERLALEEQRLMLERQKAEEMARHRQQQLEIQRRGGRG